MTTAEYVSKVNENDSYEFVQADIEYNYGNHISSAHDARMSRKKHKHVDSISSSFLKSNPTVNVDIADL